MDGLLSFKTADRLNIIHHFEIIVKKIKKINKNSHLSSAFRWCMLS